MNLDELILYQGSKCPIPSDDVYTPDEQHDFRKDWEKEGLFNGKNLKGIHCKKCGLTIKYPENV